MAVEMPAFEVRLDAPCISAQLSAAPCDHCQAVTLQIDSEHEADAPRPVRSPSTRSTTRQAQGATLFYLPGSGRVTRIQLWH